MKREVLVDCVQVALTTAQPGCDQCHHLGRESEPIPSRPEERLDSSGVSGEHQLPGTFVRDSDGPHAFQSWEHLGVPLLESMDHDLGIAPRLEPVATSLELPPQLIVVVDLAVEEQREISVLVSHRILESRR